MPTHLQRHQLASTLSGRQHTAATRAIQRLSHLQQASTMSTPPTGQCEQVLTAFPDDRGEPAHPPTNQRRRGGSRSRQLDHCRKNRTPDRSASARSTCHSQAVTVAAGSTSVMGVQTRVWGLAAAASRAGQLTGTELGPAVLLGRTAMLRLPCGHLPTEVGRRIGQPQGTRDRLPRFQTDG